MKLIELSDYKDAEGIKKDDKDNQILMIIESVSQLVKSYCGISFLDYFNTDKVEELSIYWLTPHVFLTESPVLTVSQVEIRESPTNSYSILDSSEWAVDSLVDGVTRLYPNTGRCRDWPVGPNVVRVTYRAGYSKCPSDLKLAVIDLVNYYMKDEHKQRQSLGTASTENAAHPASWGAQFPAHIKRILDLYKVPV